MMRQRQLPSQICSTEPVGMSMDSFSAYQDKCTIPTPSQTCHHVLPPYMLKATKHYRNSVL